MVLMLIILLLMLALGLLERHRHLKHRGKVPVRIQVNGIRGKSGTTRLIAAGLRAGGLRTLAKTTGTEARLILEDGSEVPYRRAHLAGPPSISEQKKLLALADKRQAEVLVSECMAVHPDIQRVAEDFFIQAQIGVLTNIRLDHTDAMGDTYADIAACLALTTPRRGKLVLGPSLKPDSEEYAVLAQAAQSRETTIIRTVSANRENLPDSYFAENVAVALEVCKLLNVPEDVALAGMGAAQADPGSFKRLEAIFEGRMLILADAFSANDPESTLKLWQDSLLLAQERQAQSLGLFANRSDRGYRVDLFAEHFLPQVREISGNSNSLQDIAILGEGLFSAKLAFGRAGFRTFLPFKSGQGQVPALLRKLNKLFPGDQPLLLFGFGNSKGMGNRITHWFVEHGTEGPQC